MFRIISRDLGDLLMSHFENTGRYVFETEGVCPPEIHFRITGQTIEDIRFVGGGCPGNAQLVSRLIKGQSLDEVKKTVEGILCRNGTSCPEQLALAIQAVEHGTLAPAESFRTLHDPQDSKRVGLIGELEGNIEALEALIEQTRAYELDALYCLGNLTGTSPANSALLKAVRKAKILTLQGNRDWQYAQETEPEGYPPLGQRDRDWLLQLPQVLRFQLAQRSGMAFFGEFVQHLPGFSDFEQFALEMNMVCDLTRFMADEAVFPALEAMVPQFNADLVLFGQTGSWGHWHVAGKDFVSVGKAFDGKLLSWGLMETEGEKIGLQIVKVSG